MNTESATIEKPKAVPVYTFPTKETLPPGWDMSVASVNLRIYQQDKTRLRVIVDFTNVPTPALHVSCLRPKHHPSPAELAYVHRHFMLADLPVMHMIGRGYSGEPNVAHLYQFVQRPQPIFPFPVKHSVDFVNAGSKSVQ